MAQGILINHLYTIFYYAALFAAPPLIAATLLAFIVGLFQAVTQIQEQTLPQTIKIFVISLVLIVFGGVLAAPLYTAAIQIFNDFHLYSR